MHRQLLDPLGLCFSVSFCSFTLYSDSVLPLNPLASNLMDLICCIQGMACRPNTHRPSFHVNMVGLEKTQRSKSSRFPRDLGAEMMDDEDEFELWFQQALASGLFCEPSKRRKSWSPFKMHPKKGKQQWRRWS